MDIMLIREIRGWNSVTPLPHSPTDVLGVMNLRGAVVPIVDLSRRLDLGPCEFDARNVIIIAIIGDHTVGFLVNAVCDIVGVAPDKIQPMPDISGPEARNFVQGIIASENRTLRVLNVDALAKVMTDERTVA